MAKSHCADVHRKYQRLRKVLLTSPAAACARCTNFHRITDRRYRRVSYIQISISRATLPWRRHWMAQRYEWSCRLSNASPITAAVRNHRKPFGSIRSTETMGRLQATYDRRLSPPVFTRNCYSSRSHRYWEYAFPIRSDPHSKSIALRKNLSTLIGDITR